MQLDMNVTLTRVRKEMRMVFIVVEFSCCFLNVFVFCLQVTFILLS